MALLARRGTWLLWLLAANTLAAWAYRPEGVDPYEALGLRRGDDLDAGKLKQAYRKAALRWHPDKVPAEEKEAAEKKFIEIAWAYEVLSDASRRQEFEAKPGTGSPAPGGGAHSGQGQQQGGPDPRDFDMEQAARTFRGAFGTESAEYRDLIEHLMRSSATGDKKQWRRHAEAIAAALKGKGSSGAFDVETRSADGSEQMRTSQSSTVDKQGTVTKTTVTQHSSTKITGGGGQHRIHGGGGAAQLQHDDIMKAHQAAHEAAVRQAEEHHKKLIADMHRTSASLTHGEL